jgi:hypothetical protein
LHVVDRAAAGHDGTIAYSHVGGWVHFTVALAKAGIGFIIPGINLHTDW